MAQFATRSTDEALDIVQDSMFALVQRYSDKPEQEWKPLFFRILQNRIKEWHRRNSLRNRWHVWLHSWKNQDDEETEDPMNTLADPVGIDPGDRMILEDSAQAIEKALRTLPLRQQQAFLLRAWEEMSIKETARAMGCSEGSVKTHYSRALNVLRQKLENPRNG